MGATFEFISTPNVFSPSYPAFLFVFLVFIFFPFYAPEIPLLCFFHSWVKYKKVCHLLRQSRKCAVRF